MRLAGLGTRLLVLLLALGAGCVTTSSRGPEEVLRALVRANAEKDLATLSSLMAHDGDIISYTLGGRKYVGWNELAREMQNEFASVARLEIPITHLTVWTRGDGLVCDGARLHPICGDRQRPIPDPPPPA